jgi:formate dehydrogenase subunit delta
MTMEPAHGHGGGVFDDEPHVAISSEERLVIMANQIARFFSAQKPDKAVAGVADHIAKFWDPRMRQMIRDRLPAGGAGLDPLAKAAIARLGR